ncbi:MAG: ion transporter [Gammaproteobacteria bacterium]|nr:ion transporter [Gammaproteobacteria bacterium]
MNHISKFCAWLSNHRAFKAFIITIIILAGVVVGVQTYEFSSPTVRGYSELLSFLDHCILAIFTAEAVIKILAKGNKPFDYFKNPWNIFDFTIVAVCYVAFFLPNLDANTIAVIRLARIMRVVKLVSALPKLQLLVSALLKSIPSMFYVSILLFMLFYIYGAIGVFFFSENDPIHFQTLHRAMLSLFRIITLEDWTDIMYINMYGCDHPIWGYSKELGCNAPQGKTMLSGLYFISFVLMGTMIVLNLFIGVIMSAMEEASAETRKNLMTKKGEATPKEQIEIIHSQIDDLYESLANLKAKL